MQNKKIGIIGGGQLGMMLIESAQKYDVEFYTLDPEEKSSAAEISSKHFVGSLKDEAKILEMAEDVDIITFEIEHINIDALKKLEAQGKTVIPSSSVLEIIQDKGKQKNFYKKNDIPSAPYVLVSKPSEWKNAVLKNNFEKFAAKLCRDGYDGKGVELCEAKSILENENIIPFDAPTVLEQFIENEKEISIIVARDTIGNTVCYDAVEMEFDPKANLVTYLFSPANISEEINEKAKQISIDCINKLNGVGIFAVELFLDKEHNIYVNEVAPRPHNSGHHTIEASYTSQYEQLLRILLGLSLGSPHLIKPAAMLNILGGNFIGEYYLKGEDGLSATEGVYIHMYKKKINKPKRKLGHITIIAPTLEEVKEKAKFVINNFSIEPNGQ